MAPATARLPMLWLLAIVSHSSGDKSWEHFNSTSKAIIGAERETLAGQRLDMAKCESPAVNLNDLQLGLRLGLEFLVRSQRPSGKFHYEYNLVSRTESKNDNHPARQAGVLWSLTLLHTDDPKSGLMPVIRKGLQYFNKHSVEFPGGLRLVRYPGQDPPRRRGQQLGPVAILALAHIEVLRRPEALESAVEKQMLEAHLAGYLRAILAARTGKNTFYKYYQGETGKPFGPTSPFFDGECLLALIKAAKYLGHAHLWPQIKASAEAGWGKHVLRGLKLAEGKAQASRGEFEKAEKRLKGYYHWGSMAWYELMGVEDSDFAKFARRMLRYSDWVRRSNWKARAQVFEGVIPAFVTAVREGNGKLERKFACAIRKGLDNLHSLQVGHTKSYGLAEPPLKPGSVGLDKDQRAQGGVQDSLKRSLATLRIDFTQHQLHALLMARRLLQQQALI